MEPIQNAVITGAGALCAAGRHPAAIWGAVKGGVSALSDIRQWDTSGWPRCVAGEIPDFDAVSLLKDRKIQKFIRRSDVFGLYAAEQAIAESGLTAYRDTLDEAGAAHFNDRSGVYVGSGGGSYQSQYDYFPLLSAAQGDLQTFGRELGDTVNPMWLLRTLPNNVLCHVGIRHGLKGSNACITNHSVSGMLAIIEAAQALRYEDAERVVAVGHDAPVEPQAVLYFHQLGLLAQDTIRSFDRNRDGSLFGEGAAALVLETAASASMRNAPVLGEVLGSGYASDGEGLLAIRDDGAALSDAIDMALEDAKLQPSEVGVIVAHANGTRQSDASEAAAIARVFGADMPPVTGFKWAFGHLIAASGIIETVQALYGLREGRFPGIATLRELDPAVAGLRASAAAFTPRSDVALVISRGFGGTNAVVLIRAASGGWPG
jgi:3-oxoacyl-[acyl-carrier-protein] synthase I